MAQRLYLKPLYLNNFVYFKIFSNEGKDRITYFFMHQTNINPGTSKPRNPNISKNPGSQKIKRHYTKSKESRATLKIEYVTTPSVNSLN